MNVDVTETTATAEGRQKPSGTKNGILTGAESGPLGPEIKVLTTDTPNFRGKLSGLLKTISS